MGLAEDLELNRKQRMEFVEFWANYVATHPDREWSRQLAVLINSQIQKSRQLMTKELYLYMKSKK